MTEEQRSQLADRLFAEHIYQVDYIRGSIGLLAGLPVVYGVLTLIWGQELWAESPIYATALTVPYAPQSWGSTFIVLGTALLALAFRRRYLAVAWVSMALALVQGMFMVMFATEFFGSDNESALPPALIYAVLALLLLNLWRLGTKMHRLDRVYSSDQGG